MIYKAYLKQDGEGCDYTIGCGVEVVHLSSTNIIDAEEELKNLILEEYQDEKILETATIMEIFSMYKLDVESIYRDQRLATLKEGQDAKEDLERREFKRLKEKFGQ